MYGEQSRSPEYPRIKGHEADYPVNQCDGCRAGLPVNAQGFHRMAPADAKYPDYLVCQRAKYATSRK